jgi:hypothetical protein
VSSWGFLTVLGVLCVVVGFSHVPRKVEVGSVSVREAIKELRGRPFLPATITAIARAFTLENGNLSW